MNQPQPHQVSRRGLLAGAGAVAAGTVAVGLAGTVGAAPAAAAPAAPTTPDAAAGLPEPTGFGPVAVLPGDARYENLLRGNNFRYLGDPDEIRVVGSTAQVARAVSDAVRSGRRIAVRSGGHCFENFTADPAVRLLVDLSPMDAVGYDPRMRAFAVQPGATLGHVYRTLCKGWGVTIPAGGCPEVGAGGHIAGGGYGPISRRYGSVVDYLYAVEVVVVDRTGSVHVVTATREPDDPNRDLWWAHTGGGGGNFGVVTRYWLRSPNATGDDPTKLLPPEPSQMLETLVVWSWTDGKGQPIPQEAFTPLVRNYCTWHENNSAPGAPNNGIYGVLGLPTVKAGSFQLVVQVDNGLPNAQGLTDAFVNAVIQGAPVAPVFKQSRAYPWLHLTTWPGIGEPGDVLTRRYKLKAAYLRKSYTDAQLATIYQHLTNDTGTSGAGMLLVGYGGQVGAVAPGDTATAQRDAVMKAVYQTQWLDSGDDTTNLTWVRQFYQDVYRETGGVPVPGDVSDGSYINYPDNDLADPAWNTSGVPWSTLYYKDNYPRLQQIKAKWDPRNVFHHTLSIELPS
jgi:hypothetical protein